ncbi:MAG: hypothetical protein U9R74_12655, partial [Pseudomonadota bacterium]|nr:hypothetical protein [Pseudomonadota bacterium]
AARLLAPFLRTARVPKAHKEILERGIGEYIAVQAFNAERPETQEARVFLRDPLSSHAGNKAL